MICQSPFTWRETFFGEKPAAAGPGPESKSGSHAEGAKAPKKDDVIKQNKDLIDTYEKALLADCNDHSLPGSLDNENCLKVAGLSKSSLSYGRDVLMSDEEAARADCNSHYQPGSLDNEKCLKLAGVYKSALTSESSTTEGAKAPEDTSTQVEDSNKNLKKPISRF